VNRDPTPSNNHEKKEEEKVYMMVDMTYIKRYMKKANEGGGQGKEGVKK